MDDITWENKIGHTDASDIGLGVGEWPSVIVAEDAVGDKQAFAQAKREKDLEGDLFRVRYESKAGHVLFVYND